MKANFQCMDGVRNSTRIFNWTCLHFCIVARCWFAVAFDVNCELISRHQQNIRANCFSPKCMSRWNGCASWLVILHPRVLVHEPKGDRIHRWKVWHSYLAWKCATANARFLVCGLWDVVTKGHIHRWLRWLQISTKSTACHFICLCTNSDTLNRHFYFGLWIYGTIHGLAEKAHWWRTHCTLKRIAIDNRTCVWNINVTVQTWQSGSENWENACQGFMAAGVHHIWFGCVTLIGRANDCQKQWNHFYINWKTHSVVMESNE